jgi:hypothetical protein
MMIDGSLFAGISMVMVSVVVLYKAKTTAPPKSLTKAMCPCGHGINFHEKLSGRCHAHDQQPITWYSGKPTRWEEFSCDCQVYAGPELIRGTTGLPILPLPEVMDDDQ